MKENKCLLLIVFLGAALIFANRAQAESCVTAQSTVGVNYDVVHRITKTCYTDSSHTKIATETLKDTTLPINDYDLTISDDGSVSVVNKNDSSISYTYDNVPLNERIERKFNKNGYMISQTGYQNNSEHPSWIQEFEKNNHGNLSSFKVYYPEYNPQGDLASEYVEEHSCDGSTDWCTGETITSSYTNTYSYTYDEKGQKKEKYKNGVLVASYEKDGSYTAYDSNGEVLGRYHANGKPYAPKRRIYTVQEALEATSKGGKNTFSIKSR